MLHTCVDSNSTLECFDTVHITRLVVEILLRDSKVFEVNVRKVQVRGFEGIVDMGMVGNIGAGLDDKNGERGLALGKSRRQDAPCRAASNDDIVVWFGCHIC